MVGFLMSMKSGQGKIVYMNHGREVQMQELDRMGVADFYFFGILLFHVFWASGLESRHWGWGWHARIEVLQFLCSV
jgi:hypothetical protein